LSNINCSEAISFKEKKGNKMTARSEEENLKFPSLSKGSHYICLDEGEAILWRNFFPFRFRGGQTFFPGNLCCGEGIYNQNLL